MSKKITLSIFSVFISFTVISQQKIKGNGILTTKKTPLDVFYKADLNNDFEITLIKSNESAIEIETDENIHNAIKFSVVDSVLVLKTYNKIKPKKGLKITIFCTNTLREIQIDDDVEIETLNTIHLDELILKINDYAKANISLNSKKFNLINNNRSRLQLNSKSKLNIESPFVDLSLGASSYTDVLLRTDSLFVKLKERATIKTEGNSNYSNILANESTDFKGKNLSIKQTFIATKGEAEAIVQTIDNITIEASESSEIKLYGNPKVIINKFTNNAKILKKELK